MSLFYKQRYDRVPLICGAVILAFIIRGLATYGQSVTLAKIGNNLVARYQKRIFEHLMRLGVGFFNDTPIRPVGGAHQRERQRHS